MLCSDEGFDNFDVGYVGGFWVLIEFKVKYGCNNFIKSDGLNHWVVEK